MSVLLNWLKDVSMETSSGAIYLSRIDPIYKPDCHHAVKG